MHGLMREGRHVPALYSTLSPPLMRGVVAPIQPPYPAIELPQQKCVTKSSIW